MKRSYGTSSGGDLSLSLNVWYVLISSPSQGGLGMPHLPSRLAVVHLQTVHRLFDSNNHAGWKSLATAEIGSVSGQYRLGLGRTEKIVRLGFHPRKNDGRADGLFYSLIFFQNGGMKYATTGF